MARISKYKIDTDVTKDDFVIGSDGGTKVTRNYKLEDLTSFFSKQQEILGNKFVYEYDQDTSQTSLGTGKISFNNKNVNDTPFSGVTNIYLNRYNTNNEDVYDYLVETKDGSGVLNIYNASNTTMFGVFRIQTINLLQNNVIQLVVDVISESGTITGGNKALVFSLFSQSDKTYTHTQITASTTWNINHLLNKYPSVSIVDDGNNIVVGDIQYTNTNELTVSFEAAVSGKAYIN